MAKQRVILEGENLGEFDFDHLTLKQLFAIKAASGYSGLPFAQGLGELDPLALQTLVWFMNQQRGDVRPRESYDFDISQLKLEEVPEDPSPAEATSSNESSGDTSAPSESYSDSPSQTFES